jgi:large subunit ribosomal protein L15
MKAPFNPMPPKDPMRSIWAVNNDPGLLDEMYVRLLGREGPRMLQEEIKWLAVTHKSFDQGRRGFNDKLAYFGRTALIMECAQWISSSAPRPGSTVMDKHGRTPFRNRSLEMCDNLNVLQPLNVISREKIQKLALNVGLDKVLRWKPKDPTHLEWSGFNVVLNGAMYAIVGAIWLQNGAEVGGRVIRDKIFRRVLALE